VNPSQVPAQVNHESLTYLVGHVLEAHACGEVACSLQCVAHPEADVVEGVELANSGLKGLGEEQRKDVRVLWV